MKYTGQKISIDFHEADLRAVLRLLGEQAGKSIVTSPEVKGVTTISMQQVPWDQVLDTLLGLHGLTKREEGNVITVLTLTRAKQDESDRAAAVAANKTAPGMPGEPPRTRTRPKLPLWLSAARSGRTARTSSTSV